eukprot:m.88088 g.88088  ORF g.88088 m.88088 type:complete len:57 (-) comp15162_c0_seq2:2420-2590(-)
MCVRARLDGNAPAPTSALLLQTQLPRLPMEIWLLIFECLQRSMDVHRDDHSLVFSC